jgi:subtilase family serine protease
MKHLKPAAAVVNLAIVISCCISCSSVPPSPTRSRSVPAAAGGHAMLAPHLPDAVANGKATMMDTVGLQQRLQLAIQLPLRNQAELTRLLHDLYDPKSPKFHKYMSVSAFTGRFGATAGDYSTVVTWAKANGFTVTATTPNRRLVAVEGSVDTINRAFHVKVCNYRHPTEERAFYSPDREPTTVGLNVALLQITGMNNYVLPHSMLQHKEAAANFTGSGPSGEYLPSDIRAAYYGKGPLTGAGQSIGISGRRREAVLLEDRHVFKRSDQECIGRRIQRCLHHGEFAPEFRL